MVVSVSGTWRDELLDSEYMPPLPALTHAEDFVSRLLAEREMHTCRIHAGTAFGGGGSCGLVGCRFDAGRLIA